MNKITFTNDTHLKDCPDQILPFNYICMAILSALLDLHLLSLIRLFPNLSYQMSLTKLCALPTLTLLVY